MRVRMLVVAMIATPMFASVSHAQNADHANQRYKVCEKLSPAKNKQGADKAGNSGKERREPRKCVIDNPPPPPPPTDGGGGGSVGVSEIHGMAFTDANGNGTFDAGDTPLVGWVIQLSGPAGAATTTGADGSYSFLNLGAGTYTVCAAAGMTQVAPTSGPSCPGGAAGWSADIPTFAVAYLDQDFALR